MKTFESVKWNRLFSAPSDSILIQLHTAISLIAALTSDGNASASDDPNTPTSAVFSLNPWQQSYFDPVGLFSNNSISLLS